MPTMCSEHVPFKGDILVGRSNGAAHGGVASVPFLGDDELLVSLFSHCVLPGAGEGCIKHGAATTGGWNLGGIWGTFRCGLADGP